MNLRARFALALGALAAAATITAGVMSYLSTRDRLNDEVDSALRSGLAELGLDDAIEKVVVDRGEITFYVRRSRLLETGRGVVQLLSWEHRDLAEAFAGLAPAPGGLFRLGSWQQTSWGPVLSGVSAWAGFVLAGPPVEVGWSVLVDGVIEEVHLGEPVELLVHRRGRYVRPA